MDDVLRTGLGGEITDEVLQNVLIKPLWYLATLSLSQIRPNIPRPPGVQSLHSACLSSISRNFHLFSHESFEGVPAHITQRVFHRLRADRDYEDEQDGIPALRPDETSLWALSALLDAQVEPHHTLALPMIITLPQLAPNENLKEKEHPFVVLPKLFAAVRPTTSFLTTLLLDGKREAINDHSIVHLKWCTHLTTLWTRDCGITDMGIKLVASSLELPERRGMCRLRAWYVAGCKGVTDRSMRSFARFPGLVLLDVRDTSCTDVAIEVFNRSSQLIFSSANADFQACTSGLLELFAKRSSPSRMLSRLASSLMPMPKSNPDNDLLSLHLMSSTTSMDPSWLPEPPSKPQSSQRQYSSSTTYRAGGIGQIYGGKSHSLWRIEDEAMSFRQNVSTALKMQSIEDDMLLNPQKYFDVNGNRKKKKNKKGSKPFWEDRHTFSGDRFTHRFGKTYKPKKGEGDGDKSKAFYTTGKGSGWRMDDDDEKIEGAKELMMVRMVCEEWENLTWSTTQVPDTSGRETAPTQAKVKARGNLVGDLLATTTRKDSKPAKPIPAVASAFRPSQRTTPSFSSLDRPSSDPYADTPSSPPVVSSSPSLPSSQDLFPPIASNPFRSQNPLRSASQNHFRLTPSLSGISGIKPLVTSSVSSGASHDKMDASFEGFTSTTRKRSFEGSSSGETKRRGMKMFSGRKL